MVRAVMKYGKGMHVDAHSEGCLSLKYHLLRGFFLHFSSFSFSFKAFRLISFIVFILPRALAIPLSHLEQTCGRSLSLCRDTSEM